MTSDAPNPDSLGAALVGSNPRGAGQRRRTGAKVRPVLIVVNQRARRARDVRRPVEALRESVGATVLWPGQPEELDQPLSDAVAEERTIVVAGGDGTVHSVLQRLWQLDLLGHACVGLLPYGAGNRTARGAEIPLDPGAAALVILGGGVATFGLVVDQAGVVAPAVHLGPRASLLRYVGQSAPEQWLRRVAASVARQAVPSVQVRVDDLSWEGRTPLITIAPAPEAAKDHEGAAPDSLQVTVTATRARRAHASAAWRAASSEDPGSSSRVTGKVATIAAEPVLAHVGGEAVVVTPPLTYRAAPVALTLLVP